MKRYPYIFPPLICQVIIGFVLSGCAGMMKQPELPFSRLAEQYRTEATDLEKKGLLYEASQKWRIVASLFPDDPDAAFKADRLREDASIAADRHFTKGKNYVHKGKKSKARREFIMTLALNPGHEDALGYLKTGLYDEVFTLYTVQRGESLERIASNAYGDPSLDFLIAYFNGITVNDKPVSGAVLKLPNIKEIALVDREEPERVVKKGPAEKMMEQALKYFDEGKYRSARGSVNEALKKDRNNKIALAFAGKMNKKADLYYERGMEYFIDDKIGKAVKEWKKAVALNPEFEDAAKDIQFAVLLQDALDAYKKFQYKEARSKAVQTLEHELTNSEAEALLDTMSINAEEHYKKGVKYYLEEKLEPAISEWEITLMLNPEHADAKKNIEKCRVLIRKIKSVQ